MKSKILGLLATVLLIGPTTAGAISFTFADDSLSVALPSTGYVDITFSGTLTFGAGEAFASAAGVGIPCLSGGSPCLGVGWIDSSSAGMADRFTVRVPSASALGVYSGIVSFWSNIGTDTGAVPFTLEVFDASAVPEPGTLALLGLGLAGLGWSRRRRAG